MTHLFRSILQVGMVIVAILGRLWKLIEPLFYSKAEMSKRTSAKFETLKRKEMEIERLDRLRNPSDYQGR